MLLKPGCQRTTFYLGKEPKGTSCAGLKRYKVLFPFNSNQNNYVHNLHNGMNYDCSRNLQRLEAVESRWNFHSIPWNRPHIAQHHLLLLLRGRSILSIYLLYCSFLRAFLAIPFTSLLCIHCLFFLCQGLEGKLTVIKRFLPPPSSSPTNHFQRTLSMAAKTDSNTSSRFFPKNAINLSSKYPAR